MEKQKSTLQPAALALTVLAALLRLVPHPPNFAPISGMGIFGGARLPGWQAYVVPLLAMLITDPLLSHMAGYPAFSKATPVIYLSLLIYVVLGRTFLRGSSSPYRIAVVALVGSVQFFVVTNLFEWWFGLAGYAHTWLGFTDCFFAALPFFGRTVLADLFYVAVLFAGEAALVKGHMGRHTIGPQVGNSTHS